MSRSSRKEIHPHKRDRILMAFRDNCAYCGAGATTIDHVVPVSAGGSNTTDNLVAACSRCNAIAGPQVFESFQEKRHYIMSIVRPTLARAIDILALCDSCKATKWCIKEKTCFLVSYRRA